MKGLYVLIARNLRLQLLQAVPAFCAIPEVLTLAHDSSHGTSSLKPPVLRNKLSLLIILNLLIFTVHRTKLGISIPNKLLRSPHNLKPGLLITHLESTLSISSNGSTPRLLMSLERLRRPTTEDFNASNNLPQH